MQIPADAWQVGPWNRYAYVHVSDVVPTVPVSSGEVRELRVEPVDLDLELDPYTDGLAVVRDGALLYERYGGEMDATSLHLSQSVGKSVLGLTAAIVGVDPQALVTDFVAEVGDSGYAGATVRHLLDMTAAIDFVEDYQSFVHYDAACGWHPPIPGSPGSILEFLPTIGPAAWGHGERWHYATPNTDLLGLVVERVAGAPLAQVISERLWAPMGAEADAELTVDPAGMGAPGGGFCARLRDYARLGALVADRGRGIVPPDWIAALGATPIVNPTTVEHADGYANQWWTRDGRVTARGIHGQTISVAPNRTVVAILSSWPDAVDERRDAFQRALVAHINA
ncbi:serine hydrolase [Solirubrobacter sp. CPCC 204708]|uniref:Serine hydrolase n=1 Tax=Solirubrobacter deserti TaxID=2282478 RepID=A0ABT4RQB2_9ACTN|nr:serine hydrolase [Solirubrobacter deserti]MBE2320649.1 serine hydrolase [Solirubrobacter deserti]MDA0140702.1 serine hydrolase [Solirubrobacter deserti]